MKRILLLALLAGLVGAVIFLRPSSRPAGETKADADPHDHDADSHSSSYNRATARNDLDDTVPANADIAQLKAWLKERNHHQIEGLLVKMALDLKEHPERLAEILDGLKTERNPSLLPMLTRVIIEGGAITNQAVLDAAMDLAKNHTVESRRHAGQYLLGEIPDVTPDMSEAVVNISREAKEPLVRTSALATMADWMENHPEMKNDLSGEILKTVHGTDVLEVRANGLLFIANHLETLPENFTTEMINFLKDSSHYNRSAAAQALAKLPHKRAMVVPLIEEAMNVENNSDSRRLMLNAIVRASGTGSREILQRYVNDPGLRQDAKDFLGILDSGTTDPREIVMKKDRIDVARNPPVIEKH